MKKMSRLAAAIALTFLASGCAQPLPPGEAAAPAPPLSEAELRNLVERSYQYVAMFNVNNKMALDKTPPSFTGGYNRVYVNSELLDHTHKFIARPNNDTLYVLAMVDVTEEPLVLVTPAFDSVYVSLMATAYDH